MDGFGIAEITTHLHNAHTPFGATNPVDYINSINDPVALNPLGFKDYHYPNYMPAIRHSAELATPTRLLGSPRDHDHHLDFTAQNVYKGMFGCYTLFDDLDTGDETTGICDCPAATSTSRSSLTTSCSMMTSSLVFDLFDLDGILR